MLKHKTIPAGVDQPGFAGVTPSLYAEEHLFSGGTQGAVLTRNTLNSDGSGWVTSTAGLLVSAGANEIPAFTNTIPSAAQDTITRLGTITVGVWNGTIITVAYGGTGLNTSASTGVAQVAAGVWSVGLTLQNAIQDNITRLGTITVGVWIGTKIGLAKGGTNADLSATGGASQVLKQSSVGAAITVGTLASTNLSDAANVALLDASNVFTGANNTFAHITLGTSTGSKGSIRGDVAGYLTVQSGSTGFLWRNTANNADLMTLTDAGIFSVLKASNLHSITGTSNSQHALSIVNGSSGNAALGRLVVAAGATSGGMYVTSEGYITSGVNIPSTLIVSSSGHVTLYATDTLKFYSGAATTEQCKINSAGLTYTTTSHAGGNNCAIGNSFAVKFTGTPTGIAGGADGRVLYIINNTGGDLILSEEDAASTAANRFATIAGMSIDWRTNGVIHLMYNSTNSRWMVIGTSF